MFGNPHYLTSRDQTKAACPKTEIVWYLDVHCAFLTSKKIAGFLSIVIELYFESLSKCPGKVLFKNRTKVQDPKTRLARHLDPHCNRCTNPA